MKSIIFFFFLISSALAFGQAEFVVDKPMHKFPKVNECEQLEHAFTISNTGDSPLIISSFDVACTCTKVILPPPVPPGGTAEIVVKFDTNGKYYVQDRKIILHTNTKKKTEYLRFKAYVIPEDEMKR
jgi:hypothetical protein